MRFYAAAFVLCACTTQIPDGSGGAGGGASSTSTASSASSVSSSQVSSSSGCAPQACPVGHCNFADDGCGGTVLCPACGTGDVCSIVGTCIPCESQQSIPCN